MAMNRIPCPECGAALKSPTGFDVGQTVCCPKCETYFAVEEPAEDNEATEEINKLKKTKTQPTKTAPGGKKPVKAATLPDDDDEDEDEEFRPKKKKKKKKRQDDDDEERSYKNSPLRFAVLGVLVTVMLVGLFFLIQKYRKEHKEEETASSGSSTQSGQATQPQPGGAGPVVRQPGAPGGFRGQGGGVRPPGGFGPGGPNQKLPNNPGGPGGPDVIGGLFGTEPTPAEKTKLLELHKGQLAGTWKADLGGGVTAQLVYTADGKVTETINSPMGSQTSMGTWSATGAFGRKGLLVTFVGLPGKTKPVKLIFEDDELQYPVLDPVLKQDVIGIFRKS